MRLLFTKKLPLILAILLYILIYLIRRQQGGWEVELDLYPNLRADLDKRISQLLPSPQAQLLSGIVLGNKKDLPADLKLALRDTSTLHIVVVSGQNLTLLGGLILSLSGLIRRKIAIITAFLAIIFYTILTGAQIPVLRAAIMVFLSLLAQVFGRERDGIWVLMITAALLLLINPRWISDLSFQLSFLATAGVIIVAPVLLKYLKNMPIIGQDLAVTTGAQLMVMPIIAQYFHQLSIVGIITNLLIGWTVPFIMILGPIMLVLEDFAILAEAFLTYFIYIVQFFSSLSFAWVYVGEQLWMVWVGYYMVLGGILLGLSRKGD